MEAETGVTWPHEEPGAGRGREGPPPGAWGLWPRPSVGHWPLAAAQDAATDPPPGSSSSGPRCHLGVSVPLGAPGLGSFALVLLLTSKRRLVAGEPCMSVCAAVCLTDWLFPASSVRLGPAAGPGARSPPAPFTEAAGRAAVTSDRHREAQDNGSLFSRRPGGRGPGAPLLPPQGCRGQWEGGHGTGLSEEAPVSQSRSCWVRGVSDVLRLVGRQLRAGRGQAALWSRVI